MCECVLTFTFCTLIYFQYVFRAFDHIFETIQVSESSQYLVHASYLEIYNEDVRDLLGKDSKMKLDLKEHPDKGVYIQGAVLFLGCCWPMCVTGLKLIM